MALGTVSLYLVLLCPVDPQILVHRGRISRHHSVNRGVAQIGNRVAHRPGKAQLGKLVVNDFHDVFCLGLLVTDGVSVDIDLIEQRNSVFNVGCPHTLNYRIVALHDGHGGKLGGGVHALTRHKNARKGHTEGFCNL